MRIESPTHIPSSQGADPGPSQRSGPVGIFDSGVGGLSVWQEIARQLAHEDTVYLADQAHVPYGPRPLDEIQAFSQAITSFLLEQTCKLVVVACNTASAAALQYLRRQFPAVPIVGMEPAVKPAAEHTHTRTVGVLATQATFQGQLFASVVERFASDVRLVNQVCPGLVGQVEAGRLDTPDTLDMLREYLAPVIEAGADTVVLACTHYAFLAPAIRRVAGSAIEVIDPSPAVARQVRRVLEQRRLLAQADQVGRSRFYTTGDPAPFARLVCRLTGLAEADIRQACWSDSRFSACDRASATMTPAVPGRQPRA